jgi:hypothetical protein
MRGKKVKAHHEAGHAVIARVLGINVIHVALHPVGLQNGPGVLRDSALYLAKGKNPATQIIAAENDAKILLAGPIAQCFYRPLTEGQKRKAKEDGGWRDDYATVQSFATRIVYLQEGRSLPDLAEGEQGKGSVDEEKFNGVHPAFSHCR